ncbi:MAG: hypothetical protein Q8914_00970 [Bacteroidota bacterium]|nr:hypothetical protein [Bacteroidota bacterium]
MKKRLFYLLSGFFLLATLSCSNNAFIDDLYVKPQASFTIDNKSLFDVFEAVHFTNTGSGQKFVVFPGDTTHVYGKAGNTGFSCNSDGTYSYSYQEPGEFTAVWVASSINSSGDVMTSVDSVKIKVVAADGGLSAFSIPRVYKLTDFGSSFFYESYGEFVNDTCLICPMPYAFWTKSAIKKVLGVKFALDSGLASLYWESPSSGDVSLISESTNKVFSFYEGTKLEPQTIKVVTSSGYVTRYEAVCMVIPEFTTFKINNISGTQTRDITAFNKFNIALKLPAGTSLTNLAPEFVVMANDVNLIDETRTVKVSINGQTQTSGVSTVDFSAPVQYVVTYSTTGKKGQIYNYSTTYNVTVTAE